MSVSAGTPILTRRFMVDVVLYNGEDFLFDLRLKSLPADKFIVVEGEYTFQGEYTGFRFRSDDPRTVYVQVFGPPDPDPWVNERRARQACIDAAWGHGDMYYFCDMDEFWKPVETSCPVQLGMNLYYYYFNLYKGSWNRAVACPQSCLGQMDSDWDRNTFATKEGCGWHYSYVMSPAEISRKLKSFSHTEFRQMTLDEIRKRVSRREDLFGRGGQLVKRPLEGPDYLLSNTDKYREYIL